MGPGIDTALAYIPTFPLTQNLIDRGVRGDYVNLFVTVDFTNARIKRGLLLGTRLGQDRASLIPAPGDPGYDAYYTKFPLGVGTSPPFGPDSECRRGTVGTRGRRLMLTRFVRIQLAIFTIASIVGVLVMVFTYMQAPTLLGIGRITVKLELPASGGLYRFSNVTYRGVEVGKVTAMDVSRRQATATFSLDTTPKIPADLVAEVRSVSAVGEQYVELMPRTDSPPYLQDGSVIAMADTKIPQSVGPMLDQVSTLINSVPKDKLSGLVDESFNAFNGAGYDLGSLFDSSAQISGDLNKVARSVLGAHRRLWSASGFAGADDGRTADVGEKPGGSHRPGSGERPAGAHTAAGGAARGERSVAAPRPGEADVAGTAWRT